MSIQLHSKHHAPDIPNLHFGALGTALRLFLPTRQVNPVAYPCLREKVLVTLRKVGELFQNWNMASERSDGRSQNWNMASERSDGRFQNWNMASERSDGRSQNWEVASERQDEAFSNPFARILLPQVEQEAIVDEEG